MYCLLAMYPLALLQLDLRSAPSLEVQKTGNSGTIDFRVRGEDAFRYRVEISTNLSSWETDLILRTTNGAADFELTTSYPANRIFLRARELSPEFLVEPQLSPSLSVNDVITPDGGKAEMLTPDFRRITLTIPPGCVPDSQEFKVTLVTNFTGLPFAAGSFGAVQLEPEDLILSGAASLEIEYLPGSDRRQVISFSVDNDGSNFALELDRILTNRVIIPITRFRTYGSALSTPTELGTVLGHRVAARANPEREAAVLSAAAPDCPVFHLNPYSSIFPPSCYECFNQRVQRALQVRVDLLNWQQCTIVSPLVQQLATTRQAQLAGQEDDGPTVIANGLEQFCPFYKSKIEPLWIEAHSNCALGVVLFQFMISMERQAALVGATNFACDFTLENNLNHACLSAKECLQETEICCTMGHKGWQKVQEALMIERQFTYLGENSCFTGELSDPAIQSVIRACLTNAWFGNLVATQKGQKTTVTTFPNGGTKTEEIFSELRFEGFVFRSDEFLFGGGGSIALNVVGSGAAKRHQTTLEVNPILCKTGSVQNISYSQSDFVAVTNAFGTTNDAASVFGSYLFNIMLNRDGTYSAFVYNTLGFFGKTVKSTTNDRGACDQAPPIHTVQTSTALDPAGVFPSTYVPLTLPLTSTNQISGSYTTNIASGDIPTVISLRWDFYRNTNKTSLGP